ncbi:hypothetical protein NSK_005238 [Nannochloropsis salina CCMP1776]|uniref:Peptidase S9 prolyl oligopeptidase catalytic domain-containing protein n=1 Tax=Nannochloropsis salina CCMP1776 TaxID=1027361 RepID=A0A4D9D4J2_9STRA|nr:hypothetical protein NSK_005238 [Nannochloropsis salina CCMP1776]|eukprot:TFJ83469.1 hypothetical protein NSK_005238 [Nannochloropsis salina CCMP1776]
MLAAADPVVHQNHEAGNAAVPPSSSSSRSHPRLLLASGGYREPSRRESFSEELRQFLGKNVTHLLFIPYGVRDYDACLNMHVDSGMTGGYRLQPLHREDDPAVAIRGAQGTWEEKGGGATFNPSSLISPTYHPSTSPTLSSPQPIYVCGGNVFRLLRELRRRNLLQPLQDAVLSHRVPYVGISAGTVLACPTVCTSNDMPVVDPSDDSTSAGSSLQALGLVKFQINAHYYGGEFYSREPGTGAYEAHAGMRREERIQEFLEETSEAAPVPVLGLPEGYLLRCEGEKIEIRGGPSTRGSAVTIFKKNQSPLEVEGLPTEDIAALVWGQAKPSTRTPGGMVPLHVLFGNPVRSQARLSPDGVYLSFLAPDPTTDVLNVWVVERAAGVVSRTARMVTSDHNRGIRQHFWAENSREILYLQDVGGDENWHLFSVPLSPWEAADARPGRVPVRDLTPFEGVRAENVRRCPRHPDELLVGLNLRSRAVFDVYRVSLATGSCVLDTENPGDVLAWYTDKDFEVRGAFAADAAEGGRRLRVRDKGKAAWREILAWDFEETSEVVGFNPDGDGIYVLTSVGSDTTRLVEIDCADGQERRTWLHDPRCDVGQVLINKETLALEAAELNYLTREWRCLEEGEQSAGTRSVAQDFAAIEAAVRRQAGGRRDFRVVSRAHKDALWVVAVSGDTVPTEFFLYYRATQALDLLFVDRPQLLEYSLGRMQPLVIPASDGEELVSYLTLPPALPPWTPGAESSPLHLPLVLLVHGGPWARDSWGFSPVVQLLASRGYAVLQVNYRGSAGFGKSFVNKGNGEWGIGSMQRDLTESVRWAVQAGVADPARVAIMGGSYGGYATLAGLCFTPELYKCGVDIVGPAHLKTLFGSIPPYWAPMKRQLVKRVGNVEEEEAFNRKISPVFHAKRIRAPLMIVQGANDPRVKKAESDQMVASMRAEGLEVCYLVYPDEGHGLVRPPNKMDMYHRIEAFLKKHLGGKMFASREDKALFDGTSALIE